MSKSQNQHVAAVEVETPKATKAANKPVAQPAEPKAPRSTPVNERLYSLEAQPSIAPKGKQRQIVLKILADSKTPLTVGDVAKAAELAGLTAVGGIEPSCRYHLHHLVKLGFAKIGNPTIVNEEKAA